MDNQTNKKKGRTGLKVWMWNVSFVQIKKSDVISKAIYWVRWKAFEKLFPVIDEHSHFGETAKQDQDQSESL